MKSRWSVATLVLAAVVVLMPDFGLRTSHFALGQTDAAHEQFLFAYKLLQRGDAGEAAAEFDRYLRQYPDSPKRGDALYYRALLYRQAGDPAAVVNLLGEDQRPTPQMVPPYAVDLLLGQSLSDRREYDAALAVLARIDAGQLDAGVATSVYYLRGLAARGAGELDRASQELTAAAELDGPGSMRGRALLDLARVQVQRGDVPAAKAALDRALALKNREIDAEAARFAGDLAYDTEAYPEAVAYYDRVIRDDPAGPHYAAAVVGKLWALYAAGRDGAVVETFTTRQQSLPVQDRVAATYLAGSAQQRLGQNEQAVALLEPVSRGDGELPLEARVLYRLAVSYHALGEHDRVIETVARLKKLFPDSELVVDAEFLVADSTARSQGAQAGSAELTRFVEQGPGSPYYKQALRQRAELYEAHGQLDAALRDYGTYLDVVAAQPQGVDIAAEMPIVLRYAELLVRADRADEAVVQLHAAAEKLDEQSRAGRPLPTLEQEVMFQLGTAQAGAGDDVAALATLDTLRREHPIHAWSGQAELKRGALLRRMGRDREAIEAWIAAEQDETLSPAQRALTLRAMAQVYREAGRDADAAVTLNRAAQVAGAEGLSNEELLWLARREIEQAGETPADTPPNRDTERTARLDSAQALLAVLDTDGRDATATQRAERLFLGGRAALARGDLDAATEQFGRVIALGEGFDLNAQLGLAAVAERQRDFDAAAQEYQLLSGAEETTVAAEAMLRYGLLQRDRAASLRRQGNDRAAIDALASARRSIKKMTLLYLDTPQVQPTPQRGLVELAEIAESLNEPAVALREYAQLAEHFPDSPWGRYAAAVLAQRRDRRPDDALAILRRLDVDTLPAALGERVIGLRSTLEGAR